MSEENGQITLDTQGTVVPGDIIMVGNHKEYLRVIEPRLTLWRRLRNYWFRTWQEMRFSKSRTITVCRERP